MNGFQGINNISGSHEEKLFGDALNILSSIHASIVNFHLYPPGSEITASSVDRALSDLTEAMARWGPLIFSEAEGKLLINEFRPDEREQARPHIVNFLKDLSRWKIHSITFEPGLDDREFRDFIEVFGRRMTDRSFQEDLKTLLSGRGIEHIEVDEKVYMPLSKGQGLEDLREAGESRAREPDVVDMLEDEAFVRYLMGHVRLSEVDEIEVSRVIEDPEQLHRYFLKIIEDFEKRGGPSLGPEKARLIRDTVNRMNELVVGISDEGVKASLKGEIVKIISTLEPAVLVDILAEERPAVIHDAQFRRDVFRSMSEEKMLWLADEVMDKYRKLIEERDRMSNEDYQDIFAVMNKLVEEVYSESPASLHPEITRKLRENGVLEYIIRNHPEEGSGVDVYGVISDLRSSGNLRVLENCSDVLVAMTVRKLFLLGEEGIAGQIIRSATRNLSSEYVDNRLRALKFFSELYNVLKEGGVEGKMEESVAHLLSLLEWEEDHSCLQVCSRLLGEIANDRFCAGDFNGFSKVIDRLVGVLRGGDSRYTLVREAFDVLHARDVGKRLADMLFDDKEEVREIAASVLSLMDPEAIGIHLVTALKEDRPRPLSPQLAWLVQRLGRDFLSLLEEELDRDNLEEVYVRVIELLEAQGSEAAIPALKRAANNPLSGVRARALRALARLGEDNSTLLPLYLEALKDEEIEVRRAAVRGLGTVHNERAVEALLEILQGKSPLGKEDYRVEEAACLALVHLGSERALPLFMELARKRLRTIRRRTTHPVVKAAACYGMSRLGGAEVVPVVRSLLEDEDPVVRNEASKAIRTLRQRGML
jgi:HEAT repeat protein